MSATYDYYSTTETQTNKIWIDGKPIYRKVFDNGSYTNNLSYDVNDLNIETLIDIEVLGSDDYVEGNATAIWTISAVSSADNRLAYIDNRGRLVTTGGYYKRYAIIEYTKTTDFATSTDYDADYYSTTETQTNKIWIDGKPIYRKVFDNGSYTNNLSYDVNDLNIETLIRLEVIGSDSSSGSKPIWVISTVTRNVSRQAYIDDTGKLVTTGNFYKRYAIIEYTKTTANN